MWKHLLALYEESRFNGEKPECLFAETLIFSEGWLMRSVLKEWKAGSTASGLPFLPLPEGVKVYSEGQLPTPFRARPGGDSKAESHTHVDGIAGHFSIADGTKSGIELDRGCRYIAVFEAKLYSPIGKRTKNAEDYDQISRTAACLVHALLEAEPATDCGAHLVVLYPADNPAIHRNNHSEGRIRTQIANRLKEYKEAGSSTPELERFVAGWEKMIERVRPHFVTWEEVLAEIEEEGLLDFYGLCKQFNGKARLGRKA